VPRAYQSAGPEQADDHIEQKHPVIIAGHGRFGRVVNAMLTACGYKTTVIDHNAATVAGYKRFGVETYFGDAARQEMLLTAGLAEAKLLVVAIDNPEQALQIVEFAHKINPSMKIVARSYDSQHTYELVHAGANEIVRENFDSAVRCGKRALECLGMPKPKAEEVGNLYFHRNRHGMAVAARAYDPSIGIFENKALIDIARVEIAETERLIRQLLHDQSIAWPQDAAETTTEHGDMNMSEPVQGG
jgi:glutathione-regulated potassium-efflux system protein kefC